MFDTLSMFFCVDLTVEGLIKKEAKRTVAMLMYNKIINLINRHVSPEENWGEKNQ